MMRQRKISRVRIEMVGLVSANPQNRRDLRSLWAGGQSPFPRNPLGQALRAHISIHCEVLAGRSPTT